MSHLVRMELPLSAQKLRILIPSPCSTRLSYRSKVPEEERVRKLGKEKFIRVSGIPQSQHNGNKGVT